jgi:hypothetical protein
VYWRYWGSQIRVETPIPNTASPKFRSAVHDVLGVLTPLLRAYAESLAPDARWLYGGVVVGTELSIGVNHYHYVFGNAFVGQPEGCDPGLPLKAGCARGNACPAYNHGVCPPDFSKNLYGGGGVAQLGFKSALDLKLLTSGQPMTRAVLDLIVASYVDFFDAELIAAGLPERKVYSHTGGTFGPKGPHSHFPARVGTVIPGWSAYGSGVNKPPIDEFLDWSPEQRALPWSMPEWLPFSANAGTSKNWHDAWEANLNHRDSRFLSLANWEGVYQNPAAIQGITAALTTPRADACVTVPRTILGWANFGGTVGLRLSAQHGASTTYLNASTKPDQVVGGGLASFDILNTVLPDGATSYFFSNPNPVKAYLQFVTDGCVRDGAAQRTFAPLLALEVHGNGQVPAGPRLYSRRDGDVATLVWDAPPSPGESRTGASPTSGATTESARPSGRATSTGHTMRFVRIGVERPRERLSSMAPACPAAPHEARPLAPHDVDAPEGVLGIGHLRHEHRDEHRERDASPKGEAPCRPSVPLVLDDELSERARVASRRLDVRAEVEAKDVLGAAVRADVGDLERPWLERRPAGVAERPPVPRLRRTSRMVGGKDVHRAAVAERQLCGIAQGQEN